MRKVICKECLREGEETEEFHFMHVCLPEHTIADLTARLAEAERERDAAIAKHVGCGRCGAFLTMGGEQCVRENDHKGLHYFENDFAPTDEALRLRAEVARHKEIAAEFAQTNAEINCKWFTEKHARESAEARLTALREAVEEMIKNASPFGNAGWLKGQMQAALAKSAE